MIMSSIQLALGG